MKVDRTALQTFESFAETEQAERLARLKMTPIERLNLLETLRSYRYPHDQPTPRLQRVLRTTEFPPR